MDDEQIEISRLQDRISVLENENRLLRERLNEAGISCEDIAESVCNDISEVYDPNQGARIKRFAITDKIANDFFLMFCRGRKDVYDLRYTNPKTGKTGYYTQCHNRWDRSCHWGKKDGIRCKDCELQAYKAVTMPLIKAHMEGLDPNGNDVVAIYPMLEGNLCQLLVFDFDNHAKGAEQTDFANVDDAWKCEVNAHRKKSFLACNVTGTVEIVLSDRIYIDSSNMTNVMKRQIRRMATFTNKQYFQNLAMDMPNYDESRYIYMGADEGKYIILPRGLREELLGKFDKAGIRYKIKDERSDGKSIKVSFKGELRDSQKPAVDAMLENETGILHAATAFGKTVVCCEMIARRGVNTLILVDRADLMNQWMERLGEFLEIEEELPKYKTKTGQTRQRKTLIGNLQGAHDTMTGIVDVAMIRSLKKKDTMTITAFVTPCTI